MGRCYGIGETVLDVVFEKGQPKTAKAGGSVLNAMVSLGRCGVPVSFVSEYGADGVGNVIDDFLKSNGVSTDYIVRKKNKLTTLSMAFLDDEGKASYSFYHDPIDRGHCLRFPVTNADDALLFGSSSALWSDTRDEMLKCIVRAKEMGTLVLYDPNFRRSHVSSVTDYQGTVVDNMKMASVVKGSDEDFMNIFGTASPKDTWEIVSQYAECMICTAGANSVSVFTKSYEEIYDVPKIMPVSTIGAGDNFNAGILFSMSKKKLSANDIPYLQSVDWRDIITTASSFAAEVCRSYDNYVSVEFGGKMGVYSR